MSETPGSPGPRGAVGVPPSWRGLTLADVRTRMAAADIQIAEARLELVRDLLNMALQPIRTVDWRERPHAEPVVQFAVGPRQPEADS
jgi:hypothetical protein